MNRFNEIFISWAAGSLLLAQVLFIKLRPFQYNEEEGGGGPPGHPPLSLWSGHLLKPARTEVPPPLWCSPLHDPSREGSTSQLFCPSTQKPKRRLDYASN